MTVDQCYSDSSALRYLYVHGSKSTAMASWRFKRPGPLRITRFGRAEIINAIATAFFRAELVRAELEATFSDLAEDFVNDRLQLVDVPWRAVLEQAAELSRQHTPTLGTRSLDVLHVASALELGMRQFVTYDKRQARLAEACGLKVVRP
jgi:predicted nucleic acid-binding protein